MKATLRELTICGFGPVFAAVAALQEFDLDGGNLKGTLQPWLATCFPGLDN